MLYAQPRIHPRKCNVQNSLGFWDTNGSPNLSQMTKPYGSQQKKIRENLLNKGLCCSGWTW